jgi:hypothetical protein
MASIIFIIILSFKLLSENQSYEFKCLTIIKIINKKWYGHFEKLKSELTQEILKDNRVMAAAPTESRFLVKRILHLAYIWLVLVNDFPSELVNPVFSKQEESRMKTAEASLLHVF